jgi:predicted nucleic acid-binding protein
MSFIADASLSLRWMLPTQADYQSIQLLRKAEITGFVVPSLWHIEIANQLGLRLRSAKLSQADYDQALELINRLKITTIPSIIRSPAALLKLMQRHQLTAYDAVYLDLAIDLQLPFATTDGKLIAAAQACNIALI